MSHGQVSYAVRVAAVVACVMLAPVSAWAAGGGDGHGFPWGHFAASWVNFAIFLGILWKFALPPIQRFFAERREKLMADLNEAKRLREEAEARVTQYEAKLDALDAEREALLTEYRAAGERERDKIVEDAKRQVEKLRQDAERMLEQEVKKAIASLEQKAVDEAIGLARKMAAERLNSSLKQDALVQRYVEDLKGIDGIGKAA